MKPHRKAKKTIYAPSVWPTWILVAIAWLVARLPLHGIQYLGEKIGNLFMRLGRSRRQIAQTNIGLCFPELDPGEQDKLVRGVFQQVSIGALETMVAWLNPHKDLRTRFNIVGREHVMAAHAKGRGVILIGGHYAVIDTISQALGDFGFIDVMYRFNKNPVWEWLQVSGRKHYFDGVIEREDTRQALRRLKKGRAIWYAADQDYGAKHSVFADFFGIPAATITATQRFAKLNNSPVLTISQIRNADMTWTITFSAELTDYPSGDDQADAQRVNKLLEDEIRKHPDQYLWLHKRFKTRPEGAAKLY